MAALLVERRGGLLKSAATEQQLFDVIARPRLAGDRSRDADLAKKTHGGRCAGNDIVANSGVP